MATLTVVELTAFKDKNPDGDVAVSCDLSVASSQQDKTGLVSAFQELDPLPPLLFNIVAVLVIAYTLFTYLLLKKKKQNEALLLLKHDTLTPLGIYHGQN